MNAQHRQLRQCQRSAHEKPYEAAENLEEDFFTLKRLSLLTGRSYPALLQSVYRGTIPHVRIGRSIFVRREVVEDMLVRKAGRES